MASYGAEQRWAAEQAAAKALAASTGGLPSTGVGEVGPSTFGVDPSQALAVAATSPSYDWKDVSQPGVWGTQQVRTVEGGLGGAAIPTAAAMDLAAQQQAFGEQAMFERTGLATMGGALEAGVGRLQGAAEQGRASLLGASEQALGPARAAIEGARGAAQALGPDAAARALALEQGAGERRAEGMEAVGAAKAEALGAFEDTTAGAMQMQAQSITRGVQQRQTEIMQQARAQGLDPESPMVQEQLARVKMDGAANLGNLAGQMAMAHNQQRASIRLSYDQLAENTRALGDQLATTAAVEGARFTGLSSAQASQQMTALAGMERTLAELDVQTVRAAEHDYGQLQLAASQFEFAGASGIANYLRNMRSFLTPITPLVAMVANMTAEMSDANAASIAEVNQGLAITTPNLTWSGPASPSGAPGVPLSGAVGTTPTGQAAAGQPATTTATGGTVGGPSGSGFSTGAGADAWGTPSIGAGGGTPGIGAGAPQGYGADLTNPVAWFSYA